jgi:hypothetical protein
MFLSTTRIDITFGLVAVYVIRHLSRPLFELITLERRLAEMLVMASVRNFTEIGISACPVILISGVTFFARPPLGFA